jgi:hypothetical protein
MCYHRAKVHVMLASSVGEQSRHPTIQELPKLNKQVEIRRALTSLEKVLLARKLSQLNARHFTRLITSVVHNRNRKSCRVVTHTVERKAIHKVNTAR